MKQRRRGDHAVFNRHRTSRSTKSSQKRGPSQRGSGVSWQTMNPVNAFGKPAFQAPPSPSDFWAILDMTWRFPLDSSWRLKPRWELTMGGKSKLPRGQGNGHMADKIFFIVTSGWVVDDIKKAWPVG